MNQENDSFAAEFNKNSNIKIYSKNAIWLFLIFFAPIFGGILLCQNLIDFYKKKEANIVLLTTIAFTIYAVF